MPPPLPQTTLLYSYIILALYRTSRNVNLIISNCLQQDLTNSCTTWMHLSLTFWMMKKNRFFFWKTPLHPIFSNFAIFGKFVKNTSVNPPKFLILTIFAKPENAETHFRRFWIFFLGSSFCYFRAKKRNLYGVIFFLPIFFFLEKNNSEGNSYQTKKYQKKKNNISQNPDFFCPIWHKTCISKNMIIFEVLLKISCVCINKKK